MEERRKSKRLELGGEIMLKPIASKDQEEEAVTIHVYDCSRAGLGFHADCQLLMGEIYEANLTIWTKEVIHVFLKIVRGKALEDGYEYGAIFIGMPEYDLQRIEVYETVQDTLEELNE